MSQITVQVNRQRCKLPYCFNRTSVSSIVAQPSDRVLFFFLNWVFGNFSLYLPFQSIG